MNKWSDGSHGRQRFIFNPETMHALRLTTCWLKDISDRWSRTLIRELLAAPCFDLSPTVFNIYHSDYNLKSVKFYLAYTCHDGREGNTFLRRVLLGPTVYWRVLPYLSRGVTFKLGCLFFFSFTICQQEKSLRRPADLQLYFRLYIGLSHSKEITYNTTLCHNMCSYIYRRTSIYPQCEVLLSDAWG